MDFFQFEIHFQSSQIALGIDHLASFQNKVPLFTYRIRHLSSQIEEIWVDPMIGNSIDKGARMGNLVPGCMGSLVR